MPAGTPQPQFVYHDCGRILLFFKRILGLPQIYYVFWQKTECRVIADLNREQCFDLLHHLTFAGYRYISAVWGHGTPCIWGPIGGMESIPTSLLPWTHPATLSFEAMRNFNNLLQSMPFYVLPQRAAMSALVLVSTKETHDAFEKLGAETRLMPTVGIDESQISDRLLEVPHGPLRLLFVGNIISLKGVELAVQALKESETDARFTLIGSGIFESKLRRLVFKLGLESRVEFAGRMSHENTLKAYSKYDVFFFPSLHDSGGFAALEAMANGLPVICIDCGGLSVSVQDDYGIKVPLGKRQQVVAGLAEAIRAYDRDREMIVKHGNAARESMRKNYLWDKKSEIMSELYNKVADECGTSRVLYNKASVDALGHTVWTRLRLERVVHGEVKKSRIPLFFSNRGVLITAAILLLAACMEFIMMGNLRNIAKSIAYDTMPGLSYGGEITSKLAQSQSKTGQMITSKTKPEEKEAFQEMQELSKEGDQYLKTYEDSIYEPEDRANYSKILQRRATYNQIRQKVLVLLDQDKKQDALMLARANLRPAYFEYIKAGETLIKYNLEQSKIRGDKIIRMCYITQIAVALLAMALFIAGFSIGFFK